MRGKPSGQVRFGDLAATGRVPKGHFLKKIGSQIDWRPFEKVLEPLHHPELGRPSHPPLMRFKALLLQQWYGLSDPGLKEAITTACRFRIFWVCPSLTRFRMKPEFAGFAICWPRRG
jgi:hypothetical protein